MSDELILGHLSDIHLRVRVGGTTWDEDRDLRNELERDLAAMHQRLGPFTGLVVTGDIAFSGSTNEYDAATAWLSRLCGLVECPEENVWVVPGNHDVDRGVVDTSRTIKEFHQKLRICADVEIATLLYEYLATDTAGGAAYLAPIEAYNSFASRFGCSVTPEVPYWDDTLPLGSTGYGLRLRGLTSTLISDRLDNSDGNKLVLGPQATIERQAGLVTMTLCHHPISWMRDGDEISDRLRRRAEIQLWGHRHRYSVREFDGNLHLCAGAVQPDHNGTEFEPRYNVIRLELIDGGPQVTTEVWPRVWHKPEMKFGADRDLEGREFTSKIYTMERPVLAAPAESPSQAGIPAVLEEGAIVSTSDLTVEPDRLPDMRRRLAYRFSSLAYQRRLAIARELDLVDDVSRSLPDQELFELVLQRASRTNLLASLWDCVERERGTSRDPNPFGSPESSGK
jgi:3',5'-cyclic AMP phosphodiesterase CpdA